MAGQTATPTRELQDELVVAQFSSYSSGAGLVTVARRKMWLENATVRYTTAEGGAATAKLYAFPAGQAPTLANVAEGRALHSTTFDLNTTTNTAQDVVGDRTSNFVDAGEVVALIGTSTSTLAGLIGEAQFTTRKH